jgi:OsmC-like protein
VGDFDVVVGAGSLRSVSAEAVSFPHSWTSTGVTVEAEFTGAHLLHVAAAGCVLNDVYREARSVHLVIDGARVSASGDYDTDTWASTGIQYRVELDSAADTDDLAALLARVDEVAEIPRVLRQGSTVHRLG